MVLTTKRILCEVKIMLERVKKKKKEVILDVEDVPDVKWKA